MLMVGRSGEYAVKSRYPSEFSGPPPKALGGTPWRYLLPTAAVLFAAPALVIIGLVTIVRWLL
jgi:hypothetical protein